ncbi:RHOD [Seminavis robusta]|uniref:RHOD n=1 Tax=Seminavis robusta TaxID=568900 RepID=A0A9N8D5R8_9STRA|nr:RHOD [Seminavis robusta]|eukprot:Sro11_g008830.1 RHOD (505) ;mRNA; r:167107-168621
MLRCLSLTLLFPVLAVLLGVSSAEIIDLTSQEFYEMATTGQVDLMIDVRTQAEWNTGHIENATLMDALALQLAQNLRTAEDVLRNFSLWECRFCRVVVYCRSGARASNALQLLELAGFEGPLYNGQGVSQWTAAGYELVTTPSVEDRYCMVPNMETAVLRQSSSRSVCRAMAIYEQHQREVDAARNLFLAQMQSHNATGYSYLLHVYGNFPPVGYPWLVTVELQEMMMGMKDPNTTAPMAMIVDPWYGIKGDTVLAAEATGDLPTPNASTDILAEMEDGNNMGWLTVYSILDLFDKIQDGIDRLADDIQVVYNLEWGYPEDISIDYDQQIADEEFYATASNFTLVDMEWYTMEIHYEHNNDIDATDTMGTSFFAADIQSDLNDNKAQWEGLGLTEYFFEYTWIEGGGLLMEFPWSVHVRDEVVVEVTNAAGQDITITDQTGALRTMVNLFDAVQDGLDRNAYMVDVKFDGTYGYPSDVWIDYDSQRADEELSVTVSYFSTEGLP